MQWEGPWAAPLAPSCCRVAAGAQTGHGKQASCGAAQAHAQPGCRRWHLPTIRTHAAPRAAVCSSAHTAPSTPPGAPFCWRPVAPPGPRPRPPLSSTLWGRLRRRPAPAPPPDQSTAPPCGVRIGGGEQVAAACAGAAAVWGAAAAAAATAAIAHLGTRTSGTDCRSGSIVSGCAAAACEETIACVGEEQGCRQEWGGGSGGSGGGRAGCSGSAAVPTIRHLRHLLHCLARARAPGSAPAGGRVAGARAGHCFSCKSISRILRRSAGARSSPPSGGTIATSTLSPPRPDLPPPSVHCSRAWAPFRRSIWALKDARSALVRPLPQDL